MLEEVVKKSQENQAIHLSNNFRSWPHSRHVCHDAFTFQVLRTEQEKERRRSRRRN
jgi:hypothetical protein